MANNDSMSLWRTCHYNQVNFLLSAKILRFFPHSLNFTDKGESLADHSVKEKSTAWRTGEIEDYSYDISYLEELENHRFSVW